VEVKMELKRFKAITPSQRNLIMLNRVLVSKRPYLKKEICQLKKMAGRNNAGKIITRHKGGGHKKRYRKIDFFKNQLNKGIVTSIEYDPYRNCNIISVFDFIKKKYSYRLQPKHLNVGSIIEAGDSAQPFNGHTLPLSKIPVGSFIHNISLTKDKGATISRSAGTYSILIEKNSTFCKIRLSSGVIKVLSNQCFATMGILSNSSISLTSLGKAGRSRWLNIRPTVRGVAMNPIDHPHGGGEGKTSGGRKSSVSPWGKPIFSRRKKK
jgi:large subunit ribosomal protein L2